MSQNFDKFKHFLSHFSNSFNVICLTETWCNKESINDSSLKLDNYNAIQMHRDTRGGGVCIFAHNSLMIKKRSDLTESNNSHETLSVEIINKESKNLLISCTYRPPGHDINLLLNFFHNYYNIISKENKEVYLIGDYNLNVLNYETENIVKNFLNCLFQNGMCPIINRPTRITSHSATAIDHVFVDSTIDIKYETGIIKYDITDHFPIFLIKPLHRSQEKNTEFIIKRAINDNKIDSFRENLSRVDWSHVFNNDNANEAYNIFLSTFLRIYDCTFQKEIFEIKAKTRRSPWMTKGLIRSSKIKQRLYNKLLKNRSVNNEDRYKTYKNLFEKLKRAAKKHYYHDLLKQNHHDSKRTWQTIKEALGKSKSSTKFPKRMLINETECFDEDLIANNFNKYFVNVGPNLSSKLPDNNEEYLNYINNVETCMPESDLLDSELEDAFKSLEINKSPGHDEISSNVIKKVSEQIFGPLKHVFYLSLKQGIFPDQLKISKVLPFYKSDDESLTSNYRPISILPVFSKMLERIIYNRLYSYLNSNNLLYKKQFGFRKNHSTEHAIVELVDEISRKFEKNEYVLGVFIDLSKAFDTVNHNILLRKLESYGIRNINHKLLTNYLSNRKQFIFYNNKRTNVLNIICGVPQGSILGPLLFLIYINDLATSCERLMTLMFADDTNIFFSHKDTNVLFEVMNSEIQSLNQWLIYNKLSLNTKKCKYTIFFPKRKSNLLPKQLPDLKLSNFIISRETSIKFLGILLDENLTWKHHNKMIENKVSKSIGIMYKARLILNRRSLKFIYFSFIHSYINHANIAWGSTNKSKLMHLYRQQKHASRIIFSKDKFTHAKPLLQSLNILNVYQINIHQTLIFMFKITNNTAPSSFQHKFKVRNLTYNMRSASNYNKEFKKTKLGQFSITYRGPHLWNNLTFLREKELPSVYLFKKAIKMKLLTIIDNEFDYF